MAGRQRQGGKEGDAEAHLAGQGEILAHMLSNGSLSDVKPTFYVRDSLPTLCIPAPFSILGIMQNLTDLFIFTRNSRN